MDVSEALKRRISVRAFLDKSVTETQVRAVLDAARWSPSGGNLQPWQVVVVAGEAKRAVTELGKRAITDNPSGEAGQDPIYPPKLWDPYRTRRYVLGEAMYEKLGVSREDKPARLAWVLHNFDFFDAPVGLFFVIDKRMGRGQWAHMGMLMQSLALVAVEHGLATCMQESWATVRATLATHFGLDDDHMVYCGMALGYADPDHPVNALRSERAPVDAFTTFLGFGDRP